ncbi:MAG: hypothetical protein WA941_14425 [Nitrososphaeraceae archaeon]
MNTRASYLLIIIFTVVVVFSSPGYYKSSLIPSTYASTSGLLAAENRTMPTAESVHISETMKVPSSVGTFVILIPNEAHENWSDEKHKLITDKNSYYLPTNLIIPNGTAIVFLHADAPWDTPNPHTIDIQDNSGKVVFSSGQLDYALASMPIILPSPGTYNIVDKSYDTKEAKITVLDNETSNGNSIVGGFYTPINQVEDTEDNDGVFHPGSLQYYKEAFKNDGFDILSEYNFTYAVCDYCPGEYWPDNKSGKHTFIIYSAEEPISYALAKLGKLVKDNVYI